MKYFLRVAGVAPPDQQVFHDLQQAIKAACVAIESADVFPEEILAEDGRVMLTHDQICQEWARGLEGGGFRQDSARG
jgi:hypothetical protein